MIIEHCKVTLKAKCATYIQIIAIFETGYELLKRINDIS